MGHILADREHGVGCDYHPPLTLEPRRPSSSMELDEQGFTQAGLGRIQLEILGG